MGSPPAMDNRLTIGLAQIDIRDDHAVLQRFRCLGNQRRLADTGTTGNDGCTIACEQYLLDTLDRHLRLGSRQEGLRIRAEDERPFFQFKVINVHGHPRVIESVTVAVCAQARRTALTGVTESLPVLGSGLFELD